MSKPINIGGADREALLSRPVRETSLEELSQLFLSAAKPRTQWFIGVEVELLAHRRSDLSAATHAEIGPILERYGRAHRMKEVRELSGALVGLEGGGQILSLEPGGQVEFATTPHRSLKKLRKEIKTAYEGLREAAQNVDVGFWAIGTQPFVNRDTAPRMPKPRYEMMRAYLSQAGTRGLDMMHLTGSVQCAVDFQSEANLVNKVRTAARASPFLSALVAASPFTEGKPNGFKTRRYHIWLDTDNERCGIWPEMVDGEGLTMVRYLRRAMTKAPMFFIREGKYLTAERKPFAAFVESGFQGTTVTVADLLDHLTTFFPEIRPKGYVELRGADCLPAVGAVAVAGFWRGILDDEPTRMAVEERLSVMTYEEIKKLQPAVAELGLNANSAAGNVGDVVEWLTKVAYERLRAGAPDCAECVAPLYEQAKERWSPADRMLDLFHSEGIEAALRFCEI